MRAGKGNLTLAAISAVLQAVAEVEGWQSSQHDSIRIDANGDWVSAQGMVLPSDQLLDRIAKVLGR